MAPPQPAPAKPSPAQAALGRLSNACSTALPYIKVRGRPQHWRRGSACQPHCIERVPRPLQTAVHYGYIPTIILLGMTLTEPRPSLAQLLSPM